MIGQTVSHYRILEELGGGGMGVVYKAQDTKLKRTVALKFLPPELTRDSDAKTRFIHEARAASALQHNNICAIHEIGETPDGRLFICMDAYEGETIKEKIARGPLSHDEAVDIVRQVAAGLSEAHEAGMVHRDIKPANILVTSKGVVKILDFGLAKLKGTTKVTKTGMTVGTVAYMSPEQASGADVDRQTDIWSLGVAFYEMITGILPFRSEHEVAVVYSILNETPRSPRTLREDLPVALERVIMRALCKDKKDRYATADEIQRDLTQYERERLAARERPIGPRQLYEVLRQRRVAVPALLLLIALALGATYFIDRARKARWARQVALPEIEQLAEYGEYDAAYELASRVERFVPDDPVLLNLWPRISRYLTIHADPPGADVFWREYAALDKEWEHLGKTPLDSVRIPKVFPRLRLRKDGFREVNVGLATVFELRLDKEGTVPDGMVCVPGGTSEVGLAGLTHLAGANVGDFLMDAHEVTNSSYEQFVKSGGYHRREFWKHTFIKDGRKLSWEQAMELLTDRTGRAGPATWEAGSYLDGEGEYPVTGVSWYEAAAYAEYAGKKLPTIFHWNHAAGTRWAGRIVPISNYGNRGPAPVGQHQGMSPYGTCDMAGNVREWCSNQSGGSDRFVLGGGWNDPLYSFTDSYAQPPLDRSAINGFRCIRDLDTNGSAVTLERKIEILPLDFRNVAPISDETFAVFRRMYDYDKRELHANVESIDHESGDWTREIVSFDAAYAGERVVAHLFLPKKVEPPFQTVLFFPGTAALELRSSDKLEELWWGYIGFLVKSGRAFVFPIYKSTFERGDGLTTMDLDLLRDTNVCKDHVIMWVKDFRRVIDYLESRSDIDTDRIAYFGSSWGGPMGPLIMAVEGRLKTGVLVVAGLDGRRSLPEVDILHYLPRVTMPVLILNGRYDYYYPVETSQKPMFDRLGTPTGDKRLVISDEGHAFPRARLIEETLNWLDRYLGPVAMNGASVRGD